MIRTQVGIVGAGPAGLMLSHLLAQHGIESVVLEARAREYVEKRLRAGVLEYDTVNLLTETGVGERLAREGLVHRGLELRYGGQGHRIALDELTGGRTITVYGQQEVVKDLIAARLAAGGTIEFEVSDVDVHDIDTDAPRLTYRTGAGTAEEIRCDVIAGCDGSHGVCRDAIPAGVLTAYEKVYPFAWLGVLAQAPPSSEELIYTFHERGFALHSMRSPSVTRLYLQVPPEEDLGAWSDDRIWSELSTRMSTSDGEWKLAEGPILERGITGLRSFVSEPMRYGRLFLAGDATHIVPATGAKGLNLAVADVRVLARGLAEFYASGSTARLDSYSATCLRRVWRVQHFSWWMTSMLHRAYDGDEFGERLRLSQLDYVTSSRAAAVTLAENYVGLPFD
jgi:p-hydroxybenzoate 3-monooxygenase